jgi:ribosomal protein S18 acetylase RimI-like enzyme
MRVSSGPGFTAINCGLNCDTFNLIILTEVAPIDEGALADAIKEYRHQGLAWCLWAGSHILSPDVQALLASLGLKRRDASPAMSLQLDAYSPQYDAGHVRILLARTPDQVADFAGVIAQNWTPPDSAVSAYYALTANAYLNHQPDSFRLALLYDDPLPVAVLEICAPPGDVAGLYALATRAAYQRRGLGRALTTFALNALKAEGYKEVVLQASEAGLPLYRQLGFEAVGAYEEWGEE